MEIDKKLSDFIERIKYQTKRKSELYDGFNRATGFDKDLNSLVVALAEEIGEVASSITRDRFEAAKAECIDVAHCAFLLYSRLIEESKKQSEENSK